MKRIHVGLLAWLLLIALPLWGCRPAQPAQAAGGAPIQAVDMMGRSLSLDAPATRVVALAAADCEILYALGAGDALVGRGEYCDYPAAAQSVPKVQSGYDTNLEQLLTLEPQVVFMSVMAQPKEQVDALESAGIRVVSINAQDLEGVYEAIGLIGTVMGRDAEAAALVADMQADFADLARQAAAQPGGKSVYFETSPLEWGLWTAGKGTFMEELAALLNLTNVFNDLEGWAEVSQEQVIERDPAYIVTLAMAGDNEASPVAEILGRPGWENLRAIRDGNVFRLDSDALTRPGPRLVEGARALYDFVYGGRAAPGTP